MLTVAPHVFEVGLEIPVAVAEAKFRNQAQEPQTHQAWFDVLLLHSTPYHGLTLAAPPNARHNQDRGPSNGRLDSLWSTSDAMRYRKDPAWMVGSLLICSS